MIWQRNLLHIWFILVTVICVVFLFCHILKRIPIFTGLTHLHAVRFSPTIATIFVSTLCGVSGFGFRVSGFGFLPTIATMFVSTLCRLSGFGFRISGFGFRDSGFGFRVSDIKFCVSGFGISVGGWCRAVSRLGLGFRGGVLCRTVSSFEFQVSGFGFRISGVRFVQGGFGSGV